MKKLLNYLLLCGVTILLAACSSEKEEIVPTEETPSSVPHIYITTANPSASEIASKDYYVEATLEIDGKNV